MRGPEQGRRVCIAVEPRLLADTLARGLGARIDAEITVVVADGGVPGDRFDVAVVTDGRRSACATTVIRLGEDADPVLAASSPGSPSPDIDSVAALVEVLRALGLR